MRDNFQQFPPTGVDLYLTRSRFRAGPGARGITGRFCYHGEVWLRMDRDQHRSSGISSILIQVAFFTAMQRWLPDYIFGFMPRPVAFKGFAESQVYMHAEPGSLLWARHDTETVLVGFMVWMSRLDLQHIMWIPFAELVPKVPLSEAPKPNPRNITVESHTPA